jgi:hypothetical protein
MTKHQEHVAVVRQRLVNTIKHVPKVSRRGGLTGYGTFAEKMAEVAKARGAWPWKQQTITSGGAPKDLATALKKFAEGKQGMHTKNLHLIELTCVHYEMEAQITKGEREATGASAPPPAEPLAPITALLRSSPEERIQGVTEDPEFAALRAFATALEPLSADERKRVLQWAADKFGLEFAVVPVKRA